MGINASILNLKKDEEELTFDIFFDQAPIGIAISRHCDQNGSEAIVRFNATFEQITGRTKEELNHLGWAQITHPDDLQEDIENFRRLKSGEIKAYSMDKRLIKPDGSIIWVNMIVAPVTGFNDRQYNVCLLQDITERKAVEKALSESERSKSVLFSHLPGLAYRCNYDRNWTMQYVSEGCYSLTGYMPESLLYNRDLSYNDLIAPEYREELWNEWIRNLAFRKPFNYEYEIITATGERKWVLERGQGIFNDKGEVEALEGIILDISDKKEVENSLKYNNEHDRWTGLYNRDYLVSLLKRDLNTTKNIKKALIGIDLSMVHLLTSRYGFQYSQNLIKKAAEALEKHSADNRLLFHPHQNRFIFYLFDYHDKSELADFSNVIAKTLESLFATERISGGIGILEVKQNQSEADIDLLLRKLLITSERFIYPFGKDFDVYFYDEKIESIIDRERDIVEALNDIAGDHHSNNELFLLYQPIMDLKTGFICGFEALARLRTEKLGLVSPLEFITIAEKTKLILPIGEKVMKKAFGFLKKLEQQGFGETDVSINISVIQLLHPDFTSRLFEIIRGMQVNPRNISIEITESVFASDLSCINRVIEKLQQAGMYIAIDDFGTGYSSLSREKELKADCIKIDKYFVDTLFNEDLSKAITGDIISMSHKLGHSTIAEGVENDIQLQYLKEHGCCKIQGYLISKPLDEADALEFLIKHNSTVISVRS